MSDYVDSEAEQSIDENDAQNEPDLLNEPQLDSDEEEEGEDLDKDLEDLIDDNEENIINEVEDQDDHDKKRKKKKDLSDAELEDEDYDLIEENLGIKVQRKKFRRIRMDSENEASDQDTNVESRTRRDRKKPDSRTLIAEQIFQDDALYDNEEEGGADDSNDRSRDHRRDQRRHLLDEERTDDYIIGDEELEDEDYDSDNMDDFIVRDGPPDITTDVQRRGSSKKQLSLRANATGAARKRADDGQKQRRYRDENLEETLMQAQDVFGCDFDFENFDGAEDNIDDDLEGPEDDTNPDRRSKKETGGKTSQFLRKLNIHEWYEPSELEARHLTESDAWLRSQDAPERFLTRLSGKVVSPPFTETELQDETDWIFDRAFTQGPLSVQEIPTAVTLAGNSAGGQNAGAEEDSNTAPIHDYDDPFASSNSTNKAKAIKPPKVVSEEERIFHANCAVGLDINYQPKSLTCLAKIREVLHLLRVQNLEVPFIAHYRKECWQPELTVCDLWKIYHWDERWCVLRDAKASLLKTMNSVRNFLIEELKFIPEQHCNTSLTGQHMNNQNKISQWLNDITSTNTNSSTNITYNIHNQTNINNNLLTNATLLGITKEDIPPLTQSELARVGALKSMDEVDDYRAWWIHYYGELVRYVKQFNAFQQNRHQKRTKKNVNSSVFDTTLAHTTTNDNEDGPMSEIDTLPNDEDNEDSQIDPDNVHEEFKDKHFKPPQKLSNYALFLRMGIGRVVTKYFGITAAQFAENVQENYQKHEVAQMRLDPSQIFRAETLSRDCETFWTMVSSLQQDSCRNTTQHNININNTESNDETGIDSYALGPTLASVNSSSIYSRGLSEASNLLARFTANVLSASSLSGKQKNLQIKMDPLLTNNVADPNVYGEIEDDCKMTLEDVVKQQETLITNALLRAANHIFTVRLAKEPALRKHVRTLFRERALLRVRPYLTSYLENLATFGGGIEEESDPCYSMKFIKDKPVRDLWGDQFIKLIWAMQQGLLEIQLGLTRTEQAKVVKELAILLERDEYSAVAQAWNGQRREALAKALLNYLYPVLAEELSKQLLAEARDAILNSYAYRLYSVLKIGPYISENTGSAPNETNGANGGGVRVLGLAYSMSKFKGGVLSHLQQKHQQSQFNELGVVGVLIGPCGELIETIRLPALLKNKRSMYTPAIDRASKERDLLVLRAFLTTYRPHVIAVGACDSSRACLALREELKDICLDLEQNLIDFPPVQIALIDDDLANVIAGRATALDVSLSDSLAKNNTAQFSSKSGGGYNSFNSSSTLSAFKGRNTANSQTGTDSLTAKAGGNSVAFTEEYSKAQALLLLARKALSLARRVQDPLMEFAQLLPDTALQGRAANALTESTDSDLYCLNLEPSQRILLEVYNGLSVFGNNNNNQKSGGNSNNNSADTSDTNSTLDNINNTALKNEVDELTVNIGKTLGLGHSTKSGSKTTKAMSFTNKDGGYNSSIFATDLKRVAVQCFIDRVNEVGLDLDRLLRMHAVRSEFALAYGDTSGTSFTMLDTSIHNNEDNNNTINNPLLENKNPSLTVNQCAMLRVEFYTALGRSIRALDKNNGSQGNFGMIYINDSNGADYSSIILNAKTLFGGFTLGGGNTNRTNKIGITSDYSSNHSKDQNDDYNDENSTNRENNGNTINAKLIGSCYLEHFGVRLDSNLGSISSANSIANCLVQFLSGLGPRKGAALLKILERRRAQLKTTAGIHLSGGLIVGLQNRTQLVTQAGLGPRVFVNLAGFIRIETRAQSLAEEEGRLVTSDEYYIEVLDSTRIHPETYEWARKMAIDALEYDEDEDENNENNASASDDESEQNDSAQNSDDYNSEEQECGVLQSLMPKQKNKKKSKSSKKGKKVPKKRNKDKHGGKGTGTTDPASAIEEIFECPDKLKDLDLDAFAEELARQGFGNKTATLYDIRSELTHRYKDTRIPPMEPTLEERFNMVTKETPQTFYIGKLVAVRVIGLAYTPARKAVERLNNGGGYNPIRIEETGLWSCPVCFKSDFMELSEVWQHYDSEMCPGQPIGIKVRLENGLMGFIHVKNLSDSMVRNPEDRVKMGMTIFARVLRIDVEKFSVELTSKSSDLADSNNEFKPPRDIYYDYDEETQYQALRTTFLKKKSLQASLNQTSALPNSGSNKIKREDSEFGVSFKQNLHKQSNNNNNKIYGCKRLISHPSFRNITTYAQVRRHLAGLSPGEVLIRPSFSKGPNHLSLGWKVWHGVVQHIDIKEEGKDKPYMLGKSLWIDTEEFEDLDEILARYITPLAGYVRELANHKYFYENPTLLTADQEVLNAINDDETLTAKDSTSDEEFKRLLDYVLRENKKATPSRIPYAFGPSKEYPGKFILAFMPRTRTHYEYISVIINGLRYRGQIFGSVTALISYFKEHYKEMPVAPNQNSMNNLTMNKPPKSADTNFNTNYNNDNNNYNYADNVSEAIPFPTSYFLGGGGGGALNASSKDYSNQDWMTNVNFNNTTTNNKNLNSRMIY